MAVVLIGTLDTKGVEVGFVRDRLREAGRRHAGDRRRRRWASRRFAPDVPREQVFAAAGSSLADVRRPATAARRSTRPPRVPRSGSTAARRTGGSRASSAWAARPGRPSAPRPCAALPYGVPKLMVSTLASGQVQPYVGVRDICMMHSVIDMSGLNRFTRQILANAAAAMAGMVSCDAADGGQTRTSRSSPRRCSA